MTTKETTGNQSMNVNCVRRKMLAKAYALILSPAWCEGEAQRNAEMRQVNSKAESLLSKSDEDEADKRGEDRHVKHDFGRGT